MANNDYRTRFTNKNSVLIDASLLRTDVSEFCKKRGITQADYFNARGLNGTVLPKSLRAYYTFDKGINEKEYTRLLKAKKIPESFSDENKIGRIKTYILETICKGIKKDPKTYIMDYRACNEQAGSIVPVPMFSFGEMEGPSKVTYDGQLYFCPLSSEEHSTSLDLSSVIDPILYELKLTNTYLEKLCYALEV